MYKKLILSAAIGAALASPSLAFAEYNTAKQMALGGSNVVSGDYSGASGNPSLASNFHESDDFGVNLGINAEASDPDDFLDAVDEAQNTIDEVESKLDTGTAQPGVDDVALMDSIENLSGKTVKMKIGAGGQIAIPSNYLGAALVVDSNLNIAADFTYDPSDETQIEQNVINGDDMTNLNSYVGVTGVGITEAGIALSHSYDSLGWNVSGIPMNKLSIGVTPKYQRIDVIDYQQSIADFESSDYDEDQYKTEETGFNADIGFVQYMGEDNQYRIGGAITNLVSKKITSPLGNEFELNPVATIGGGYDNGWLSTTVEVDVNEQKGYGRISDTQYAKIGFEIDAFRNVQFRVGYRDSISGGDEDVMTAGIGISPFDVIHLDVSGLYGSNNTYGVGLQFGVKM